VNLVDLVDTVRAGAVVEVSLNLKELQDYTVRNKKYFRKGGAYAGGLLRFFEKSFIRTQGDRTGSVGVKATSSKKNS
jgi:hypothetical protein